jgi:hypothetical protein
VVGVRCKSLRLLGRQARLQTIFRLVRLQVGFQIVMRGLDRIRRSHGATSNGRLALTITLLNLTRLKSVGACHHRPPSRQSSMVTRLLYGGKTGVTLRFKLSYYTLFSAGPQKERPTRRDNLPHDVSVQVLDRSQREARRAALQTARWLAEIKKSEKPEKGAH